MREMRERKESKELKTQKDTNSREGYWWQTIYFPVAYPLIKIDRKYQSFSNDKILRWEVYFNARLPRWSNTLVVYTEVGRATLEESKIVIKIGIDNNE